MSKPIIDLPPDRHVGILFAAVFILISFWPVIFSTGPTRTWALLIALAFLAISLLRPAVLHPLNRAWMAFGLLLSRIINPLVLGTLFFVVITPVALVTRLFGRDPLKQKLDPMAKTYWIDRDPNSSTGGTMKDQF